MKKCREILLEHEMEIYLVEKGYDITDGEVTDSTKVVDFAVDEGFETYLLQGQDQEYNETLIFIKSYF